MTRREARETALALIFEYEYHRGEAPEDILQLAAAERGIEQDEYISAVFNGTVENMEMIDGLIAKYAEGWKFSRISKMSLAIMRLGIYEMLNLEDIPYNISINEAVELAKKYDHDSSHAFINGILNSIAEHEGLKKK